ncbi:TonB-dependent receptor [Aromatoleum petrolei]|uniref:TonB-dependent receptor plug domain-containing protein n=1 Tax=Aromatoleum petrolei TaxID=76116 RepID=A0ABX1MV63_9RHOO|nr:TonB-dependent receptor [Aromatoleum petrolei]NMF89969.1 TonB-dependent receptor plug domain-containing protein [Aromatoleum petrolei]QTQ36398.1 TonB-dependent receptor [Aromatoleum petrolei]
MQQHFRPGTLALAVTALFVEAPAAAETPQVMDEVVIKAARILPLPANAEILGSGDLAGKRSLVSDSAQLLRDIPGVALSGAGGVSSLPVVHGLADDRNRIKVDGMDLVSACGNHMNPPLSYIDPTHVEDARVYAGIIPVSLGGDSIGGVIIVNSKTARFAQAGDGLLTSGELGGFYRSNGDAHGVHASATLASENLSVSYQGSTAESDNYRAAKEFKPGTLATWTKDGSHWIDGDEVGSSAYKTENHSLGVALRNDNHLVELKVGFQHIPYQGFPNQHMDMTDNKSTQVNLGYTGNFRWGTLRARVYEEATRHKMDFGPDKLYWYGAAHNVAGMPMDTKGRTTGAALSADIVLSERDLLRVGSEYQRYRLDDWWAPVANSAMMSPNNFWNINDGQRDRFDVFAEWEAQWNSEWMTLAGIRSSTVKMDAGTVQGYNAMYNGDANRFNASDRSKNDENVDLSALVRYSPAAGRTYEAGYSRKTRSPSLYERYTWSTNGMAMTMNNWLNDGNGYVGDINLKPEVAHTFAFTVDLHQADGNSWGVKATPYYTRVDNYIDAKCRTTCTANRFNYLQLVNRDARLYGLDLSGFTALGQIEGIGSFTGKGVIGYVKGRNTSSDDDLYNIMPLNARLALEHRIGNWTNTVEGVLVRAKNDVSRVRNEMKTAGYGLLNLRSSYDTRHYRIDLGLENALDKQYDLPLGGAYIGQGTTMSLNRPDAPYGIPVPGMGRSLYAGFSVKF